MALRRSRPSRQANTWRAPLVALVGVVTLGVAVPVAAQEPTPTPPPPPEMDEHTPAELRDQYEELAGEQAGLLVAYDEATARLTELLGQVVEADRAKAAAERASVEAQQNLESKEREQAEAAEALESARRRVDDAEETVRRFAIESYVGEGAETDLSVMLEIARGEVDSMTRHGYRDSIDARQGELIDELIDARAEHARRRRQAASATEAARDQRDEVERTRREAVAALDDTVRLATETAAERDRQAALLSQVQTQLVSIEARIYSLERAADGIQSLLAAFQADDPDYVPGAYSFSLPQEDAEISSEFGMRSHPILPVTRLHAGADIGAASGSPVLAAADGVVLLAQERGGYGLTVVLAHGNSLGTVYAHNSALSVEVGTLVTRGQEIAKAGSTGLSTGPHIHFETRLRGLPVNPRNFLLPADGGTGLPGPLQDPEHPFAPDRSPDEVARPGR